MKTKALALIVVVSLITTQCMAQKTITVEAQNSDISNNLDLKAVASAFGESQNLEDFEKKLNDYDSQISNLDLNGDGQVDYLRVIEKTENNLHVVAIQAVLDKDVYQDVATIVVERDQNSNTSVKVIGDPYIYGNNYIIEPAFYYTPSIFSWFWRPNYYCWNSPYYWGYYPTYYHHYSPFALDIYMSNIRHQINHDHRYYYTQHSLNEQAQRIQSSISRNDYSRSHPDRNFSSRNENVQNKRDLEFNRNGVIRNNQTPTSSPENSTITRPSRTYENRNQNSTDNIYQTRPSRTYENRNQNSNDNNYQTRPSRNETPANKTQNNWKPSVNQPDRSSTQPSSPSVTNQNSYRTPTPVHQNPDNRNNQVTRENRSTPKVSQPKPVERTSTPTPTPTPSRSDSKSDSRSNSTSGGRDRN